MNTSKDDETVVVPFYPRKKLAEWSVVIGEPKQLPAIKVTHRNLVRLELSLPKVNPRSRCASYMGADHDIDLDSIDVAEGEESESGRKCRHAVDTPCC